MELFVPTLQKGRQSGLNFRGNYQFFWQCVWQKVDRGGMAHG